MISITHSCFPKSLFVSSITRCFQNVPLKMPHVQCTKHFHVVCFVSSTFYLHTGVLFFQHTSCFVLHSWSFLKGVQGSRNWLHHGLSDHFSTVGYLGCFQFIIMTEREFSFVKFMCCATSVIQMISFSPRTTSVWWVWNS